MRFSFSLKLAYFHSFLLLCGKIFALGFLSVLIFNREVSLKGIGQKHSFPDFLVCRGEARFVAVESKKKKKKIQSQLYGPLR